MPELDLVLTENIRDAYRLVSLHRRSKTALDGKELANLETLLQALITMSQMQEDEVRKSRAFMERRLQSLTGGTMQ